MDEKNKLKPMGDCIKAYTWASNVEVEYCDAVGSDKCKKDTNCKVYRNHLIDEHLSDALQKQDLNHRRQ